MSFSLVAYYESQDTSAVLSYVAAVTDQHINTQGDNITIPAFATKLIGAFVSGVNLTQAQVTTPQLRKTLQLDTIPLNRGVVEPLSPPVWLNKTDSPLTLTIGEDMRLYVAEDAAGADAEYGGIFLEGEREPVPAGEMYTVRCTGGTTLTANAWSLVPLTFTQQLEAGDWAVVGMRASSTGCVLARLVIPGSPYRPGCIGTDAVTDIEDPVFRQGRLGQWGVFNSQFPPQAEFLSASADTSEEVWLDLVKL